MSAGVATALVISFAPATGATPPQHAPALPSANSAADGLAPYLSCATKNHTVKHAGHICKTKLGVYRLTTAQGDVGYVHGPDPVPSRAVRAQEAQVVASGGTYGPSDVTCISNPTTQHFFQVLYVYPNTRPDDSATVVPELQQAIYQASAFVNGQGKSVDPSSTNKFNVLCDGSGNLKVDTVAIAPPTIDPTYGQATSMFLGANSALVAAGYDNPNAHYLYYYDDDPATYTDEVAGFGYLFAGDPGDDALSADNPNMVYEGDATEDFGNDFNYLGQGGPDWATLLHEATHTMGGVQYQLNSDGSLDVAASSPNSTGNGHCTDGLDIMCYDDGGPAGGNYTQSVCSSMQYDCNKDDYFNPAPAAGSYLSDHWNVASSFNTFLDHRSVPDNTPPTTPTNVTVTAVGGIVSVHWAASTDDVNPNVSYYIERDTGSGFGAEIPVTKTSYTDNYVPPGSTVNYRVAASDGINVSAWSATVTGRGADVLPPSAPANQAAQNVTDTGATLVWTPSTDNVGVAGYDVARWDRQTGDWSDLGTTVATNMVVGGLTPDSTTWFSIEAYDAAGNYSEDAEVSVTTLAAPSTSGPNTSAPSTHPSSGTSTNGGDTRPSSANSTPPPKAAHKPSPPQSFHVKRHGKRMLITWKQPGASFTSTTRVTKYEIFEYVAHTVRKRVHVRIHGKKHTRIKKVKKWRWKRIATTRRKSWTLRTGKAGTRYRLRIVAVNASGHASRPSRQFSVRAPRVKHLKRQRHHAKHPKRQNHRAKHTRK